MDKMFREWQHPGTVDQDQKKQTLAERGHFK